jgi:hypothetical protein
MSSWYEQDQLYLCIQISITKAVPRDAEPVKVELYQRHVPRAVKDKAFWYPHCGVLSTTLSSLVPMFWSDKLLPSSWYKSVELQEYLLFPILQNTGVPLFKSHTLGVSHSHPGCHGCYCCLVHYKLCTEAGAAVEYWANYTSKTQENQKAALWQIR